MKERSQKNKPHKRFIARDNGQGNNKVLPNKSDLSTRKEIKRLCNEIRILLKKFKVNNLSDNEIIEHCLIKELEDMKGGLK